LASFAVEDLIATVRGSKENVYTRIGVRPLINARGTWTYLSGSLELPEVRQAKQEPALNFVDMFELQRGVGKRLAELSGAESGMVTSGAAGAIVAATAACFAGSDPKNIWPLLDTTGTAVRTCGTPVFRPVCSVARISSKPLARTVAHGRAPCAAR
jgi:L-seryl-tRNA(Ser) seleniumtransferase